MALFSKGSWYGSVFYYSKMNNLQDSYVISDIQYMVPGGGGWFRAQIKWSQLTIAMYPLSTDSNGLPIIPATDTFDWTVPDSLVNSCNSASPTVNLLYCIQSAPYWRQTIDLAGNAVGADGQYCQATLHTKIVTGSAVGTIYLDIPTGHTIATGKQITVDYTGAKPEAVLATGGPYSAGTNVAVTVTNLSNFAWHPHAPHNAGVAVWNTGGQFVNTADTKMYVKALVDRYNGSGTKGVIQCLQWNEDFDTPGNNQQRDVQSQWFVGPWQVAGQYIRDNHPQCIIGGPAARRTFDDGSGNIYGMDHITAWTKSIFTYKPPGSSITGAAQWLDFLDFHYYRDGSVDANGNPDPDPNDPLPATGPKKGNSTPTPAIELTGIQAVAAAQGYSNFDVWCTETGYNISDDGSGVKGITSQVYTAGTPYTIINLGTGSSALTAPITDQSLITIDYTHYTGGVDYQEVVYAFGNASTGDTSVKISSAAGSTQVAWTPAYTHASGVTLYSSVVPYVTFAQQATYITETFEQHRLNGGSHVMIWTDNPNTNIQTWKNPIFSNNIKTITGQYQTVPNGGTPFTQLAAVNAIKTYNSNYPTWVTSSLTQLYIIEQATPGLSSSTMFQNYVMNILEQGSESEIIALLGQQFFTILEQNTPGLSFDQVLSIYLRSIIEQADGTGSNFSFAGLNSYALFPTIYRRDGTFPTIYRRDGKFPSTPRRDGKFPSTPRRDGVFPPIKRRG